VVLIDPSFANWADDGVAIMPITSIDAKNNDDFIAISYCTAEIIAVRGCGQSFRRD
jgi:hypothetical protein